MNKLLVALATGLLFTSAVAQDRLIPVYNYPGPTVNTTVPLFYVLQRGAPAPRAAGVAAPAPGQAAPAPAQATAVPAQAPPSVGDVSPTTGVTATPGSAGVLGAPSGVVPSSTGSSGGFFTQEPSRRNLELKARQEAKRKAIESKPKDWFSVSN